MIFDDVVLARGSIEQAVPAFASKDELIVVVFNVGSDAYAEVQGPFFVR